MNALTVLPAQGKKESKKVREQRRALGSLIDDKPPPREALQLPEPDKRGQKSLQPKKGLQVDSPDVLMADEIPDQKASLTAEAKTVGGRLGGSAVQASHSATKG